MSDNLLMVVKLNTPVAVAVVFMVFPAVEDFLFYRYQQALPSARDDAAIKVPVHEAVSSPEEEGVRVLVSAVDAVEDLSVSEDGRLVYDQVDASGSEEFEAEEQITITAEDGGAVQVGVGGKEQEPLGVSGKPTTRTFTPESES